MEFGFYNCDDRLICNDTCNVTQRYNWNRGRLDIETSFDVFSVRLESVENLIHERSVCEEALKLLVEKNPLSVEFKRSDISWQKKLLRIVALSNGERPTRISKDSADDLFGIITSNLCHFGQAILGACLCRGLSMSSQQTLEVIKEELTNSESDFFDQILLELICEAPAIKFEVEYQDPDLQEDVVEAIDIAVLSFSPDGVPVSGDDGETEYVDGCVSFCLYPHRILLDKEKISELLQKYMDHFIEKYETGGYNFRDTVLRSTLVDCFIEKFKEWVENATRHCKSYYTFELSAEPVEA